jgi:CRP-like cAMP-binding protein
MQLFKNDPDAQTVAAGEVIFREGEEGKVLYYIQQGEVELTVNGKPLGTLGEGSIFGEMAIIESGPRSATAKARSDCRLVAVDEKRFLFLVQQTPFFALNVMRTLAKRLREMDARI